MQDHRSLLGNLLQEKVVKDIRELNKARSARIAALKNRADAEAYVSEVRAKIAKSFPMPEDRSVPAAEITGKLQGDGFTLEKVIYFSRENFPVTANLFIPDTPGKHPGVLFVCGHSANGKASDAYQSGAITLARKGCVVLLVDPISQGERWQFVGVPNARGIHGLCTREHNMLGKQLRLCGEFFGAWRAYDALRGLDYLLSRPEVDTTRVGITGNSGGGTMTTFVQALDSRFTMAAPSCYVTSWQRNFENELPADVEQIPPGILAAGCEMGDFILAYAPRPVLLLGQKNDFFDPRGLMETYEEVKKVYALLGAEDNVQCFIGPTNHGYSIENREAMYGFFSKHAALGVDADEGKLELFTEQQINCTPSGQLMKDRPESATVHDLICRQADALAAARPALDAAALKARLRSDFKLPEVIEEPYCRVLRYQYINGVPEEKSQFSRFALEGDEGLLIPLKLNSSAVYFHFPALDKLTIYIPHLDSTSELLALDAPAEGLYAGLDVRNIGETLSLGTDQNPDVRRFNALYSLDYHYDSVALMFGSCMVGQRVLDILRAVKFVKARGVKHLELAGRGQGAIPAAFAALLSDDIEAVTLYDAPESYMSMIRKKVTHWPQSGMVPGILAYTDLPEIYAAIRADKPCSVTFVNEPAIEL